MKASIIVALLPIILGGLFLYLGKVVREGFTVKMLDRSTIHVIYEQGEWVQAISGKPQTQKNIKESTICIICGEQKKLVKNEHHCSECN